MDDVDVVVIGAGQAGLSAGYFLRRAGLSFVMLDRSPGPGGAWQYRWPTLTLGTAHRIHDLPGTPLGEADEHRPAAEVVSGYFADYERAHDLRVRRPVRVTAVRPGPDGRLLVEAPAVRWSTRALINATGTWHRPFRPYYPGAGTFRGRQSHTADYRGPADFAGRRVVVVGGGTSAVQALLEIAPVAAGTVWTTRRPPVWNDGVYDADRAREAVARVERRVRAGLPPGSVVSATGLARTPQVRAAMAAGVLDRRPMFDRIVPGGVAWDDGTEFAADTILWATGFRPVIEHLAPLRLREPGGGIQVLGTRAVRDPRVHLVGYGPSASTVGANRAGRVAVREIRELLAARTALGA
ncbi:pyridine nucleotide-disulfide oxidoreductase [Actinomadura craniellae]|uniref:Pyridine nucleotide-disulfide oxidoreductase n=1 Tax=Actinomadura craniellae TaxID=2231787 RepID=A0A365GYX4_9ACTN|nr:NAD(P)-binding domain-containing protein [Actinomadura craniellae]RAY12022.1 pyridine nucleotide-disulfide oxidoreductase [Actinomadura craniellae]